MNDQPLILVFIEDLMIATRIENTAQQLGFDFAQWQSVEQSSTGSTQDPKRFLSEPLVGPEGRLIEIISEIQPALIIFDLGNSSVPWEEWIALITAVPATRGIPVLCFGPHVDQEDLRAAEKAGADVAIPRSKFMKNLPGLLSEHARLVDKEALQETCQEKLPYYAKRGLEEFNRGEYFEAHDSLELAWMEDQGPGRELYRAVLQVAVAYYQVERANYEGALKMFLRMRRWLYPLPGSCRGINIDKLREDAHAVHTLLVELGPDGISRFDLELLKPVEYKPIY